MSTLRARWTRLPGAARVGIAVVALLVLLNVGLGLVDSATRGADETSPRSSSFSTGTTGTAGYAELLRRFAHPTSPVRGTISAGALDPAGTVLVLDAGEPSRGERRAIDTFLRAGGRLVASGPNAASWVPGADAGDPAWTPGGPRRAHATVDGARYALLTNRDGRWATDPGDRLATTIRTGSGVTVLVADGSPLQNQLLDRADNAAFGIALAGEDGRSVAFVEGPHGYGRESGLAAIPTRWKFALVMGSLAALLTLIAVSRRLGPPEDRERQLPPPRRAYVDALGAGLARSRQRARAVAPLQAAARDLLARQAALGPDADEPAIRAAASKAGWNAEEIDGLFAPAVNDEMVLRAGRSLARAERGAR